MNECRFITKIAFFLIASDFFFQQRIVVLCMPLSMVLLLEIYQPFQIKYCFCAMKDSFLRDLKLDNARLMDNGMEMRLFAKVRVKLELYLSKQIPLVSHRIDTSTLVVTSGCAE